jgi:transmembrane sensor
MFGRKSDEAVRRAARDWSLRMHGDDAATHREAFERWRAADPRHDAAYARLERQWTAAGLLAQTQIGRARALPTPASRGGAPFGYAVALALVVLTVGLGLWTYAPDLFGARSRGANDLASRVGEIRTLSLPDGSQVTLDTDSEVRLAFHPGERDVVLTRGRARFTVAHDVDRPFVVHAGTGTVTARGTVFDVSLLGRQVGVTLLRGVVDVQAGADRTKSGDRLAVRLHPGQYTDFSTSARPQPPQPALPAQADWVSGMLAFDRDRLGDALAEANRYSLTKIGLGDPALADRRITGAYRVRDTRAFAQALAVSLDLQATTQPDGRILLVPRS